MSNSITDKHRNERLFLEKYNKQGDLMKIVEYNTYNNIIVEFQDEYKAKVKTKYDHFCNGTILNPYHPSLYNVGKMGVNFEKNHKLEYKIWSSMMCRCFNEKYYSICKTYKDVICCKDWEIFENFYRWINEQENFSTLKESNIRFALDKDIIIKGNKVYSPDTCCLVPHYINNLFIKSEKTRGDYPIGINGTNSGYYATCSNGHGKLVKLGKADNVYDAFKLYKDYKESLIKSIARENYKMGYINKKCYESMLNYKVEFED